MNHHFVTLGVDRSLLCGSHSTRNSNPLHGLLYRTFVIKRVIYNHLCHKWLLFTSTKICLKQLSFRTGPTYGDKRSNTILTPAPRGVPPVAQPVWWVWVYRVPHRIRYTWVGACIGTVWRVRDGRKDRNPACTYRGGEKRSGTDASEDGRYVWVETFPLEVWVRGNSVRTMTSSRHSIIIFTHSSTTRSSIKLN